MNRIFLFLMAALVSSSIQAQPEASALAEPTDDRGYIVKTGDMAPSDFMLKMIDGSSTSLLDLRGKIVVLQFTASWCGVCRKEMPHLEKELWQEYKDRGVVLIGVDRDEPIETVKQYTQAIGVTYPFALDPGAEIFGRYAHKEAGVTRNVVIDRNGKIVFLTRLYNPEEFAGMIAFIDRMVNE
jgi:peroxiredoxin